MTRSISTYEDLEMERKRLEALLSAQRELLQEDIAEIKQELKPMGEALSFIGKITTKDRTNLLLNEGTDRLIDLVFKKIILSRSGWLTKIIVPFLMKNYSSHFVADHKDVLVDKVKSFFTSFFKSSKNGKDVPEPAAT